MSLQVVRFFLGGKKALFGAKVGDMNKRQNKWVKLPAWILILIAFAVFCSVEAATGIKAQTKPDTTAKVQQVKIYGKLPLSFEANRGQMDKKVQFIARGQGYGLFLTPTEAVLSLNKSAPAETKNSKSLRQSLSVPNGKTPSKTIKSSQEKATTLRMKLVGGNPIPQVKGLDELPGKVNYFRGKDPKQWRTNIPTYAKTKYEKVYPGIDLIYYGNQRQLEYDFIVAPGADPKAVRLSFQGTDKVAIDAQGDLVLHTADGDVRLHKPVAYQTIDGQRRSVDARFVLHDAPSPSRKANQRQEKIIHPQIGFQLAAYDATQTLVIDPVLAYSSYLGGSYFDAGEDIAVDSEGNAYITGKTSSSNIPAINAKYPNFGGESDAFVTKLNASGTEVLYSTYLGGNDSDFGWDIAVDSVGNAYITGTTYSANFPAVNAKYPYLGGGSDAFVTKLNASGAQVLYSTYLGGNISEAGFDIAVDSTGNAYVTGYTESTNFPTVNAIYPNFGGVKDAFVTKFNAGGTQVLYSTYLGGNDSDHGSSIAVDSAENAYITGNTYSVNFPTVNAIYPNFEGGNYGDAFVTKFNASGAQVLYSTYLGGNGSDNGTGISVDSAGNTFVTGWTYSANFPAVNAIYPNFGGKNDAFVTKFNASGTELLYSTYLGGKVISEEDFTRSG